MVGWSCATDEANSEAPMLSPAERNSEGPVAAARSCSIVPAKFTVLASMRPWKSLMPSSVSSTGASRSSIA